MESPPENTSDKIKIVQHQDNSYIRTIAGAVMTIFFNKSDFQRLLENYFWGNGKWCLFWDADNERRSISDRIRIARRIIGDDNLVQKYEMEFQAFKLNPFVITPSGNPFFNSSAQYQNILRYVVQFMSSGRNAVAEKDWEGRKGWYLFEDKKPNDFDEQLQTVLQYLKNEKINEQAEALAKEWGYLKPDSSNSAF
ncbi:hypothetical protein [Gynuella sp.]|uniref:hypothetical protein n=1 Tax=Gynuella sp. TaxID=2969146 RepID=UPI003D0D1A1C